MQIQLEPLALKTFGMLVAATAICIVLNLLGQEIKKYRNQKTTAGRKTKYRQVLKDDYYRNNINQDKDDNNDYRNNIFPYFKKQFFSRLEQRFFESLVHAVKFQYITLSKVRLWDIIEIEKIFASEYTYQNTISRKHIDFILLDPRDYAVVLAIELDDPSHDNPKAFKNDTFKDNALAAAGIPLLRIKTENQYSIEQIAISINEAITQHQKSKKPPKT